MQNTWLENRIIKKLAKFLLPAVTSEDAGKTAVVNSSGAWSVGESGGGGVIYQNINVTEDGSNVVYSLGISYNDYMNAVTNGILYVFIYERREGVFFYVYPYAHAPKSGEELPYSVILEGITGSGQLNDFSADTADGELIFTTTK